MLVNSETLGEGWLEGEEGPCFCSCIWPLDLLYPNSLEFPWGYGCLAHRVTVPWHQPKNVFGIGERLGFGP